jgi:hypothetical protein
MGRVGRWGVSGCGSSRDAAGAWGYKAFMLWGSISLVILSICAPLWPLLTNPFTNPPLLPPSPPVLQVDEQP